jgi:hypothetical protein
MPPTFANGKICYLEIPAIDIAISSSFYSTVFGWTLRQHADGSTAFDDGVNQVSGTWVLHRPPSAHPGIVISIMVNSAAATVDLITANGGHIVQPIDPNAREITAHFRDPAGNVLGIYQEPS